MRHLGDRLTSSSIPFCCSPVQMQKLDAVSIHELGLPAFALMESAGMAVANQARTLLKGPRNQKIIIFCGKGNNGGDGFVAARHLQHDGYEISIVMTCDMADLQGEASLACKLAQLPGITFLKLADPLWKSEIRVCDLIVDAILGTGTQGVLRGDLAELVLTINAADRPLLSIDIPTGANAHTGECSVATIVATQTISIGLCKTGMHFSPCRERCGQITTVNLGFPDYLLRSNNHFRISDNSWCKRNLPSLKVDTHKGNQGRVLVIAGSRGMGGAAALSALASLRSGAGLCVLATTQSLVAEMEFSLPEVMGLGLPENANGQIGAHAYALLEERMAWADVVAVGPGLGCGPESQALVSQLLEKCAKPLVIDADALHFVAGDLERLKHRKAPTMLTPHPGEYARVFPGQSLAKGHDLCAQVQELADTFQITLHLKGAPSITASAGEQVIINGCGNPGMATAGSGDVLTGIVAAMIAQGLTPHLATAVAAHLHGLSADILCQDLGQRSLTSSLLLDGLPKALYKIDQI